MFFRSLNKNFFFITHKNCIFRFLTLIHFILNIPKFCIQLENLKPFKTIQIKKKTYAYKKNKFCVIFLKV